MRDEFSYFLSKHVVTTYLNPVALRMAKSFGLSECNRVNHLIEVC